MVCRARIYWVAAVCWVLSASTACATEAERDRATALYEQTFGAETPDKARMPEAFALWRKLADQGDAAAMYYLSAAYFRGVPGIVEVDDKVALNLLEKAAAKGVSDAQFSLAWQYESGAKIAQDPERALLLYENAAHQGHSLAISRLIRVFSNGELGKSQDPKQAEHWQQKRRSRAQ